MCLCACSASTTPFLAGVRGACVRARVLALPRQFWLQCVVCVCVCGLGFWLQPPILAGVLGCVFVRVLRMYPAIPGPGVRWG